MTYLILQEIFNKEVHLAIVASNMNTQPRYVTFSLIRNAYNEIATNIFRTKTNAIFFIHIHEKGNIEIHYMMNSTWKLTK